MKYYKVIYRTPKGKMLGCMGFAEGINRRTYKEHEWTMPAMIALRLGFWLCVFTKRSRAIQFAGGDMEKLEVWECEIGKTKKSWPKDLYCATAKQMKQSKGITELPWQLDSVMTDKVKLIKRIR